MSSKQRDSSNKLGYKLVCAMFALTCINHASAANIFVDALPDQPGCDLAEAIIAANSNTAVGGCSAGAGEQDTIIFESFFDEYTISDVFSVNSDRGANAMPLITTKISVIGSSSKPMRLRPEGVNSRLFDVASNGDLSIENLLIENWRQLNISSGIGGAIRVDGQLEVNDSEFRDNQAEFGGAIFANSGSVVIVRRSLFIRNLADDFGGAIAQSEASNVTIFDSTFSVNESGGSGGAIGLIGSPNASLQIYNATIAQNTSALTGGGVFLFFNNAPAEERNAVTIRNTILLGNFAPESSQIHFTGEAFAGNVSLDNNLLGSAGVTYSSVTNTLKFLPVSITNSRILTSDFENVPVQSVIGLISENGGPTRTYPLPSGSPAIDSGVERIISGSSPLLFTTPGCRGETAQFGLVLNDFRHDQRGQERPQGDTCDIGAIEYMTSDSRAELESDCYVIKAKNDNIVSFCL